MTNVEDMLVIGWQHAVVDIGHRGVATGVLGVGTCPPTNSRCPQVPPHKKKNHA